jgi:hypothetical protein
VPKENKEGKIYSNTRAGMQKTRNLLDLSMLDEPKVWPYENEKVRDVFQHLDDF